MIAVEGRIEDDVFHVSAFGSEVSLLPLSVAHDDEGTFAHVSFATRKFPNGLLLSVQERRAKNLPPQLTLSLRSESPALPHARPLFKKLGGDAALARLIAPAAWSVELRFDSEGHYVDRAPLRARGSV
jgi:hypothetical protein